MNAETSNPIQAPIVIAIAVIWIASVVVCFLKGKPWSAILGIAAVVADALGPPTINGLYLFNPLITIFSFLPIWGAIRLGRPDFYWGSWFYSKDWLKYMRAVRRYGKEEEYWQLVRQGPDGEEREKLLKAVLASGNKHLARSIGVVPTDKLPSLSGEQAAVGKQPITAKLPEVPKPNFLLFLLDLPFRFVFALIGFTFLGWIGWVGLVLIGLKFFHAIPWSWWVAALPFAYGVVYCLYMTIDGALYRAGLKGVGAYARFTTSDEQLAHAEIQQTFRNLERERGKE